MVPCMKVTGETFSFYQKRKGAEGVRCHKYPNSQAKGLLSDSTLESFIRKSTEGAIPNNWESPDRGFFKVFPDHLGRIFQVKGQSKRVKCLLSILSFLFL